MPALSVPLLLLAAAGVGIAHSVLPDHWVPLAVVARTNRWTLAHTARISLLASLGHVGVSLLLGVLLALAGLALSQSIIAHEGHIVGGILVLTGIGFLIWAVLRPEPGHTHPRMGAGTARTYGHGHVQAQGTAHVGVHHHEGADEGLHDAATARPQGFTQAQEHDHGDAKDGAGHAHGHPVGIAIPPGRDRGDPAGAADALRHGGEDPEPMAAVHTTAWLGEIAVPFGVAASPDLTILPVFLAAAAMGVGPAVGALVVFAVATILTFVVLTVAATAGGYRVEWPWLDRNGHVVSAIVLIVVGGLVFVGV